MIVSNEKRGIIRAAMLEKRQQYDGTDSQFAKQMGINQSVWSRLKNSTEGLDGLVRDAQWVNIARLLGVELNERKLKNVETEVFLAIKQQIEECKAYAISTVMCDECGIGKTHTAKYLSRTMKNVFYVDASQCPTQSEYLRAMAKAIGVDDSGRLVDIKGNIKVALNLLPNPVMITDEAGKLKEEAFLLQQELWNATDGRCGWYMMGADGLAEKLQRMIKNKRVGWREIFDRHNSEVVSIVPKDRSEKLLFYKKMITDVVSANIVDKSNLNKIVNQSLKAENNEVRGLRRAVTLLKLYDNEAE